MFSLFESPHNYTPPKDIVGRVVKTKVMCTIGPAAGSKGELAALLLAGMNVARFNASHGSHAEWQETFDNLKAACSETGTHCATVLDIRGPEIRIGDFAAGSVPLKEGQTFTFRTNFVLGDSSQVSIKSWTLWKQLQPKDKLLVDYGLVSFTVVRCSEHTIECTVDNSNTLGSNKHVRIVRRNSDLDEDFRAELLSYRDTEDIAFAVRNSFDYVATPICHRAVEAQKLVLQEKQRTEASRAKTQRPGVATVTFGSGAVTVPAGKETEADKVAAAKAMLRLRRGQIKSSRVIADKHVLANDQVRNLPGVKESKIRVLLKVSTKSDVENLEYAFPMADGIMLCRSELAVSVPLEKVSSLQKLIAARCNSLGKPLVVMNHVLASMVMQPRPTRSEATDVANLVLDGVDCLVLTSPTARGSQAENAVKMVKSIARETELDMNHRDRYIERRNEQIANGSGSVDRADSLASSAIKTAFDLEAACIVCFTDSGATALRLAMYRPHCALICVTTNERVARQMQLTYAAVPIVVGSMRNVDSLTDHVIRTLRPTGMLKGGDTVVRLSGVLAEKGASSDHLSVLRVK